MTLQDLQELRDIFKAAMPLDLDPRTASNEAIALKRFQGRILVAIDDRIFLKRTQTPDKKITRNITTKKVVRVAKKKQNLKSTKK